MARIKTIFDKEKKYMTDDPLNFTMQVLKWRILRKGGFKGFLLFAIAFCQIFNVVSLYLLTKNNVNWRQYITVPLLSQPGVAGILATLQFSGTVNQLSKVTHDLAWSINAAGVKVEDKILGICNTFNVVAACMFMALIVAHLSLVLPLVGDEKEFNPIMLILQLYCRPWLSRLISMLYYIVAFCFGCGVVYPILVIFYLMAQLNFQLYLLNEHLSRLSEDYRNVEGPELLHDGEYQNVMYQRLKLCCMQHNNIKKLRNVYVSTCRFAMLYIPLASLAPVVSGYFVIYDISPRSNFRMVLVMAGFCIPMVVLCVTGQHLQNNSEEIFNIATRWPWIYWDNKNKKALLMLLHNSMTPLRFSSYIIITLNFGLALKFQKWIYSLMTVLYY